MDYISAQQATEKWDVSARRVQVHAKAGHIEGAVRFGHVWMVPKDAEQPKDGRVTTGEWIGYWRKPKTTRGNK
ncbi:DNA-binding protein [Candidatus Bathycorpusculum sp.]|uniref:DNA-binding protein n=1 Tax=Candidatus Bathycorpusculum sp. TaxID=2994959 RepID=UPI00283824E9|nr:DNA-binding protein [Candidatus Termitimicrobium sp.]